MLKRSFAVFLFGFMLAIVLGWVYNETVISERMKRMTSDVTEPEEGEEGLPDPDFEKFRLEHHQVVSFAFSLGLTMVAARMVLEGICYYFGRESCAIVSGHEIFLKTESRTPPYSPPPPTAPLPSAPPAEGSEYAEQQPPAASEPYRAPERFDRPPPSLESRGR